MSYPLQERYINLLTDFGFKRVFGTEPNKALLIDFLNTLLPPQHKIRDVTYKSNENLGNTPVDSLRDGKAERKAIFDIYCQGKNGERFIVEIQKAKPNFFKDRSVYYSTFPIQEQALKGDWNYKLAPVYTVGVLDFIFDDHQNEETLLHTVELKNQHGKLFYEKLKFIYIELPKFTKTIDQLNSHFDKWLFLLKHLPELDDRPQPLEESIFSQLFEIAEISNFSPTERDDYENSLKYYRDLNNVVNTSREEGWQEGWQEGREEGLREGAQRERSLFLQRQKLLLIRQISRQLGEIPDGVSSSIDTLSLESLEALGESFFEFSNIDELTTWLNGRSS